MTNMPDNKIGKVEEDEFGLEPEEVFLARLEKIDAKAAEAAKPKIVAAVSPKMAEAIKTNPGSLRLSARAVDETVVVDRPRRTEVLEVLEVEEGRPSRVKRLDCMTGEVSVENWVGGYRPPSGAISTYDPFSALKGNDDD
jgi:hypothetical protein